MTMTPHRESIEQVANALGADSTGGLHQQDADARLGRDGPNQLTADDAEPWWRRFLAQFQDALVVLLLIATAISAGLWAYEREAAVPYEALAILAVVFLNAILGYVQESRAEAAIAALRAMSAAEAAVIRDGERRSIPAAELVAGDLIVIEEGNAVPADARIVESVGLQTAEAALTGESLPVTKDPAPIDQDVALGDRHNMLFTGTSVTYGHGHAIVTATGMRTEMGRIAGDLPPRSATRIM